MHMVLGYIWRVHSIGNLLKLRKSGVGQRMDRRLPGNLTYSSLGSTKGKAINNNEQI